MPYRILIISLVLLAGCYDFPESSLDSFLKDKEDDAMVAIEQLAPGMPDVMQKSRKLDYVYSIHISPNEDHSVFVHQLVQNTPGLPKAMNWQRRPNIDNDSVKRLEKYLKDHHIRISPRGTLRRFEHESGGKSIVIESWEVPEGRFLLTEVSIMQP